jgi:hypothetical protein
MSQMDASKNFENAQNFGNSSVSSRLAYLESCMLKN